MAVGADVFDDVCPLGYPVIKAIGRVVETIVNSLYQGTPSVNCQSQGNL